jgi:DNA-binding protein HU-beta
MQEQPKPRAPPARGFLFLLRAASKPPFPQVFRANSSDFPLDEGLDWALFSCSVAAAAPQRGGTFGSPSPKSQFPNAKDGHEMSKKDLIDAVAKEAELTKDKATVAVDAVLEHIRSAMRNGEEVRIPDFGTFKVAARKAREGRNPATGATINIPASKVPKFSPSKGLKEILN